jgi:endoglycosylceramidase
MAAVLLFVPVAGASSFVTIRGQQFIDPEGRQVLMHGASVINKSRADNYQPRVTEEDFAQMRAWGWNCIRLGILWDGLEPKINQFDEEYLKKLDGWIALARKHDIYVFLDMHQDLYSYKYSDGAPEWATLIDDQEHPSETGAVWDDAYLTSPAIQRAFDNFWANKPCSDGVGVQDHFAAAWKKVAERYKDEPIVIGYDLFNEPNIGSGNLQAMDAILVAAALAISEKDAPAPAITPVEVLAQWMTGDGRSKLMRRLKEMDIYNKILEAGGPVYTTFERTQMVPMFQRVRDAIRTVDSNHSIFLETSMSANMGIPTGVAPVMDSAGKPDALQVFAPHAYDIVVDTSDLALASDERLELIYRRHAETGKKMNMPVLIGEWGAFGGGSPEILPTARFNIAMMEKYLLNETFWDYSGNLGHGACSEVFQRPIPVRTNGVLMGYKTDFAAGKFTCTWKEDPAVKAPTKIYLPKRVFAAPDTVKVNPPGGGFTVEPVVGGAGDVHVLIAPTGQAVERTLTAN